uniref:Ribosomal RNA processing 1 n=1 Tax=Amphiprion ocellaris TaxID=80972 RepID=A0A3Q1BKR5_AMPOC
MASIREPEVQFAQRLASNERPIRSKALKKLRKYINARSQRASDGFTGDELLKLWKGLFYCLWMQDKPLLQEELSKQISTLIHSFNDTDKQLLYLESFLLTFKREWTGIDRLRMDKFFQLVRFVFRQTFEALKRKNWESSAVSKFLEMLTAQLLQSSSEAPCGLQLHILDLYLTELATVGSAELTADQNLTFIDPFCKTAAKTKNQTLFSAICRSIFSTIIDQAPFAIEDLMKEVKAAEASEEDETQIKAGKSSEEEEEEDDDDDDDHLEEDTELLSDDIGPVLQKIQTPSSESKKVTFGLKNNKTAEFRKTDRSLLVSPDGSSRVPFDPQQKPKFGVLKSSPIPLSSSIKKTPKSNKTSSNTPKSTPKPRPLAADFF